MRDKDSCKESRKKQGIALWDRGAGKPKSTVNAVTVLQGKHRDGTLSPVVPREGLPRRQAAGLSGAGCLPQGGTSPAPAPLLGIYWKMQSEKTERGSMRETRDAGSRMAAGREQ